MHCAQGIGVGALRIAEWGDGCRLLQELNEAMAAQQELLEAAEDARAMAAFFEARHQNLTSPACSAATA